MTLDMVWGCAGLLTSCTWGHEQLCGWTYKLFNLPECMCLFIFLLQRHMDSSCRKLLTGRGVSAEIINLILKCICWVVFLWWRTNYIIKQFIFKMVVYVKVAPNVEFCKWFFVPFFSVRLDKAWHAVKLVWQHILVVWSLYCYLQKFTWVLWHNSCRYSCYNFHACSLWMSFGVYVTGVLFQTAAFVSFLLISHGYCIMCEHLSLNERRTTAALACVFYLTLVGYKACVPYFTVSVLASLSNLQFNW